MNKDQIIRDRNTRKFNSEHACVMKDGKFRILNIELNPKNQATFHFIKKTDFLDMHLTKILKIGNKEISAANAWLKDPNKRAYWGGVYFYPVAYGANDPFISDPPDKRRFNTWTGLPIQPKEGNEQVEKQLELIHNHIYQVICSGDEETFQYVMFWIAYTLQFPDRPAGIAIVLRGEKGTGKGVLGQFLLHIWGNYGVHVKSQGLTKDFNAQLSNKCFVFADEVFVSGQKKDEAALKMLITEPTTTIEPKGVDSYEQPNYLKILMATNDEYAVPVTHDERRYCVIDVANDKRGSYDYFCELAKACDSVEVQQHFLWEMLSIDLFDFNIRKVPETNAMKDQRLMSINSVARWLLAGFSAGSLHEMDSWHLDYSTNELFQSYLAWANANRIVNNERLTSQQLSRFLGKVGYKTARKKIDGKEYRGYSMDDIEKAEETLTKFLKL